MDSTRFPTTTDAAAASSSSASVVGVVPPFGLARQYGAPAVVGGDTEVRVVADYLSHLTYKEILQSDMPYLIHMPNTRIFSSTRMQPTHETRPDCFLLVHSPTYTTPHTTQIQHLIDPPKLTPTYHNSNTSKILLMVDTAAGGTVLTDVAYAAAKAGMEKGEGMEEQEVAMTGTGGASDVKALVVRSSGGVGSDCKSWVLGQLMPPPTHSIRVMFTHFQCLHPPTHNKPQAAVPMFLGGSTAREGQQAVLNSAVVASLGAHAAFDGIVGQDVLGQYPVSM